MEELYDTQLVLVMMWRKGNPSALLVGVQIDVATVESSMETPQKIKNLSAFDPEIPLPGVYPKEPKPVVRKNISIPMFINALFIITKIWK